jgi:hypothetical protein
MFLAATKTRSRGLLGLVIIGSIALAGCSSTSETAEPSQTPSAAVTSAASGLPVDEAAFAVTGEESEPLVVEFSNGTKTVTYLPMIHIARQEFYDGVTDQVRAEKEDGATLFYEYVDFDVLSDADKRKVRRMVGILPTPEQYAEIAGSGYVGQSNDDFLGLVNDKDVDVDITAEQLIKAYEDKYGEIEVTGEDATSDLSEPAASLLPQEQVQSVVLDARNKVVAQAIAEGPDKIVLVFGSAHGSGIFAELQQIDPAWQRTK